MLGLSQSSGDLTSTPKASDDSANDSRLREAEGAWLAPLTSHWRVGRGNSLVGPGYDNQEPRRGQVLPCRMPILVECARAEDTWSGTASMWRCSPSASSAPSACVSNAGLGRVVVRYDLGVSHRAQSAYGPDFDDGVGSSGPSRVYSPRTELARRANGKYSGATGL